MVGGPILLLHHVGAKSGKKRISPLLYLPDGDRVVIVGVEGRLHEAPGLVPQPDGQPRHRRSSCRARARWPCRARKATPEEREELWPRVVELYKGYAAYQRSTSREIPLVVLDRALRAKVPAHGNVLF